MLQVVPTNNQAVVTSNVIKEEQLEVILKMIW